MERFVENVKERFLRYVKINTMSSMESEESPSSRCQFDLARLLESELREIGAERVWLDETECVVYGTIPSTLPNGGGRSIGFVAHMDTVSDYPGEGVKPWIYENYRGGDVILNKELGVVLAAEKFPLIKQYIGDDIIFTDGTTVLGGDDKSAVADVMVMAEYLLAHPEIPHGPIQIAFTPDEEIGRLAKGLDLERFGAEAAYTVDGTGIGNYSDETFNGTTANVTFSGVLVHPGEAKNVMKNAVEIGVEFMNMFPLLEKPQYTEGHEGYYYPETYHADTEHAELVMLIRDHDRLHFEQRKAYVDQCVNEINRRYGDGTACVKFDMSYSSMKEVVAKVPWMIDALEEAIDSCGVEKHHLPLRGGTDGSALSARGLPCPNISAGYEYGHGKYEFASVQAMAKCTEILVTLCEKLSCY